VWLPRKIIDEGWHSAENETTGKEGRRAEGLVVPFRDLEKDPAVPEVSTAHN